MRSSNSSHIHNTFRCNFTQFLIILLIDKQIPTADKIVWELKPQKYHFLDFQAKIMLGVVNKNCLQLNNSQLQLESVSTVHSYSCQCVHIPFNHLWCTGRGLLCFTFKTPVGGSSRVGLCVRVRMSTQLILCVQNLSRG